MCIRDSYGIKPEIVDKNGKEIKGAGEGRLCIAQSWPGQMRTVYGDHQRFIDTYFSQFDGKYFSGDGCSGGQTVIHGRTHQICSVLPRLMTFPEVAGDNKTDYTQSGLYIIK